MNKMLICRHPANKAGSAGKAAGLVENSLQGFSQSGDSFVVFQFFGLYPGKLRMFPVKHQLLWIQNMEEEGMYNPFPVEVLVDDLQGFTLPDQLDVVVKQAGFFPYLGKSLVKSVCLDVPADSSPKPLIGADPGASPQKQDQFALLKEAGNHMFFFQWHASRFIKALLQVLLDH